VTRPDERRFILFPRGHVRDSIILDTLRNGLAEMVNPDTGALFTPDEIAIITQEGSRYWLEADAIDVMGQAQQARAAWFVDQTFPRRSSSAYLVGVHQPMWIPTGKLAAVGGSGIVRARADASVVWVGSSTLGDPAARIARDASLNRYQLMQTAVTWADGTVELKLQGIDGGDDTNPPIDTILTWVNPPANAEPEAIVIENFTGGANAETDAEFAARIEDAQRYRPASGNRGHFRAWAREASVSVEAGFVYSCALSAGNVTVCILQKRGRALGPYARLPNFVTMSQATAYLTPPGSPVVPGNVHVLVVSPLGVASDISVKLGLQRGSGGGWADFAPWPRSSSAFKFAAITSMVDNTDFRITTDVAPNFALPATGVNLPRLMIWDNTFSRFHELPITTISNTGVNEYRIQLATGVAYVSIGAYISPYTDQHEGIARSVEQYFDTLGPGEIIDPSTSLLAHRAYRFPRTSEEYPNRVNARLTSSLLEALGGAAGDADLANATVAAPSVPVSVTSGPEMLVLGQLGVYDIED
jgi:uncharacterized phage protein gp47/JayE